MEVVERKYRDTPIDNKKYAKRLTEYIDFLASNGKILEAKYHFRNLYEVKPNHAKTIRLGYSLSIASFDNEGVRKFDKKLYDSKPKDTEIYWFRLKYYLSVNNYKGCEDCCDFLLSKSITNEYLATIIEACINIKSYVIVAHLIKYLKKERLTLSDMVIKQAKKIALQKFVNSLVKVKCG
ncbi:hypothetical protein [Thiopseudomonas alkaliphila]|uniref:hypothetical protein n=1 Tax=Thiopseudomonas alkaliphila TaxID=1697053 RepID=UPI002577E27C|nr:hypothetical protein [Thiopseudomonas alkaliphila]MDM1717459.1 hypothetical protein [Thiopseudomonas alkaliphila]